MHMYDIVLGILGLFGPGRTIKRKFGTVDTFMRMVRDGYPMVYRPREVEFLEALVKDGRTVQALSLVGPDGQAVTALYFMERQADGSWRINGVSLLRREETTSSEVEGVLADD